ncbi:MAG: tRNA pseudouridine(38-40) synthase TruA [Pyrinomonadaceae bacterium]
MNYKLLIQYDGTDFHGWQVQQNARSIQGELERVIGAIADSNVSVIGSGRTDAGVHAEGQIANVHLSKSFEPNKLRNAINGNLSRGIRILEVTIVPDAFHARFSAMMKTYVYKVVNAQVISPFWQRYAHHETRKLDLDRMNEAAGLFLGEHDWTAFSSARADGENRVRTISKFSISSAWDDRARGAIVEFRISAKGFLRYMVRSIVGTMMEVGRNEKDFDTIQTAIEVGDRSLAGITAPAKGLTLLEVLY